MWQCLETFVIVTLGRGMLLACSVEATAVDNMLHSTGQSHNKHFSGPNCQRCRVEKPWYKPIRLSNDGKYFI